MALTVSSPIPGAMEKINELRARHEHLAASIAKYEAKVVKQASQLDRMSRPKTDDEEDHYNQEDNAYDEPEKTGFTADDLRHEEEEMRELEVKKRELEDRVSGVERDLGGLMR